MFNPLEKKGKVKAAICIISDIAGLAWEIRASGHGKSRSEMPYSSVRLLIALSSECLLDFCCLW